jgi:predicted ATPase
MTLPAHLTSFVGRRAELAAVSALLRGRRLVTLTGVGGSGKTRLAADQAQRWPDGVWWVELEAVTDAAQVAEVAAATLGVLAPPGQGPLRSLTVQLRDRRMLVCLDNCEQVLEGAAEVAQALLRSGAEVTVLTTSREPLGVAGETVWQVPPLSEDDALALFLERAAGRGSSGCRPPPADPGGVDRVEPRAAGRARPDRLPPGRRVRRRVRPGGGAGGRRRRRRHP